MCGIMRGGEQIFAVNGVRLCAQTFGDPGDPAILLISGAAGSMDYWEDEFCARLAGGLRFVIRYDHRDTGRSTSYPAGQPGYGLPDLAEDALGLLDALSVARAHIVGISMGGMIGLLLAVEHPDRIASLTVISTSPGGPGCPDNPDLPPITDKLLAAFASPRPTPDWTDRSAVIEHLVEGQRTLAGTDGWDEPRLRALAGQIVDRSSDMAASMANHYQLDGGKPNRSRLAEITAPTLVLHGTEDPLFPYGHAEASAREIPDTKLVPLEGVGHQMPPPRTWDVVVPAILKHTSGGWDDQADRLSARSRAVGDPTGWFDRLYRAAAAGEVDMPWNRTQPNPLLTRWAKEKRLAGHGRRAVVVGCGLGADAAYIAGLGYDTIGFDVAETAVQVARQRFPDSSVRYLTADLLDPPQDWWRGFDLVIENFTVQALPDPPRHQAIVNVGRLVAPGGTLLVIAAVHSDDRPVQPPPWPLTRAEIDAFGTDGLDSMRIEQISDPQWQNSLRWQAEFHRPQPLSWCRSAHPTNGSARRSTSASRRAEAGRCGAQPGRPAPSRRRCRYGRGCGRGRDFVAQLGFLISVAAFVPVEDSGHPVLQFVGIPAEGGAGFLVQAAFLEQRRHLDLDSVLELAHPGRHQVVDDGHSRVPVDVQEVLHDQDVVEQLALELDLLLVREKVIDHAGVVDRAVLHVLDSPGSINVGRHGLAVGQPGQTQCEI
jgi:pimeloyl-ACP methyl ester carboxylesterase/SAM-dependent methyltransferase